MLMAYSKKSECLEGFKMKKQVNNTFELDVGMLIATTLKATSLALIAFVIVLLYLDNQNFNGLFNNYTHKNMQQTLEENNVAEDKLEKVNCNAELNKQQTVCETYVESETDTLKVDLFEQFDYQSNKFIRQDFYNIYTVKA